PHQRGAGARAPVDPHPGESGISLAQSRDGGAAHLLRIVPRRRQPGEHAAAVGGARAARARRRDGGLLRAPAAGDGRSGFQGSHHRRHAPDDAHTPVVPALRDGPERVEHPARHPDFGAAEKAPRAGRGARKSTRRGRIVTISLVYAATTPVDPRVAEAMSEILRSDRYQANAASTTHAPGLLAKEGVEMARLPIASLIGADRREIIFTSGATEANNLAILGVAAAASRA